MAGTEVMYWDSCIFLALLKQETNHKPGELAYLLQQAARFDCGELILTTSTISITEILEIGFDNEQIRLINAMYRRSNFVFIDANRAVCELASGIRGYYAKNRVITPSPKHLNVTTPDAIHIASAIIAGQATSKGVPLLTFDCQDKPKTGELALTRLSGRVADQFPLTIVRPSALIANG